MARKERRAKARREKIQNLHRPVKASRGALVAIGIAAVIIVLATYAIKFGSN